MGPLDGTLLVRIVGDHPAARAVGEHHLASRFERGTTLRTTSGTALAARRQPGYPPLLPHDDEPEDPWQSAALERSLVAAVRHTRAGTAEYTTSAAPPALPELTTLTGSTSHGRWWVQHVACIPPVDTRGLVPARPVFGARRHLATPGASVTLCRRVPVDAQGQPPTEGTETAGAAPTAGTPPATVDCPACLDTEVVRDRLDAQLTHHPDLAARCGAMAAGAAARWWPRLAHHADRPTGAIGDAVAGLLRHGLPGAPDLDVGLGLIARHAAQVAPTTGRWASAEVERRLRVLLREVVPTHPTTLDTQLHGMIATATALLDAPVVAGLLVGAIEEDGPALGLEPITLQLASAAGPRADEGVQRWLRLHRVAAALSGGGSTDAATHVPARGPTDAATRVAARGAHGADPRRPTTLLLEP